MMISLFCTLELLTHAFTCTHTHTPTLQLILFRDALVLGVSEKEAKEPFHSKLQEARKNAFSTTMNWYIHGIAKDNRQ